MLRHSSPEPIKPSRVVVVGSRGFVGKAICRRLEMAKIDTLPLSRSEIDLLVPDASGRLRDHLRAGDALALAAARAPCRNVDMLIENIVMIRAISRAVGGVPVSHVVNISS